MTRPLVSGSIAGLSVCLVLGAFVLLQLPSSERLLLPGLASYALIAVAALLALVGLRHESRVDLACAASTAIFFGYILVRALCSPVPYVARVDLYCVLAGLIVYSLVSGPFASWPLRTAVLVPLLALGVVHTAMSLVQSRVGENLTLLFPSLGTLKTGDRATGLFVNPNHLAGFLEVVALMGLSLTCWSRWPRWAKVLLGYLTAACFLGLALTGSRGGYVAAAVGLIVFALLSFFVLRAAGAATALKSGAIALLVVGGVGWGVWSIVGHNPNLGGRVETIWADEGRLGHWRAAIEQWEQQPLVGTGSGTYLYYGRQFRAEQMQQDPVHAHNDYLELLAEYGLVGVAGLALFLVAHLRAGFIAYLGFGSKRVASGIPLPSTRLALVIGALSVLAAYSAHSAVDFNLHIPANALLLAFVFGILANTNWNDCSPAAAARSNFGVKAGLGLFAGALLVEAARLLPGEYYADESRKSLWAEDPGPAIRFARKALEFEQGNPHIFFYLGRAKVAAVAEDAPAEERVVAYEAAIAAFEKAHRLAPLDGTFLLDIALLQTELGRFAEAEKMYQLAVARDPRSTSLAARYRHHRDLWRKSGQPDVPSELVEP